VLLYVVLLSSPCLVFSLISSSFLILFANQVVRLGNLVTALMKQALGKQLLFCMTMIDFFVSDNEKPDNIHIKHL